MLIDTHCHFDFAAFDGQREQIWRECQAQGVGHLIIPGMAPAQWPQAAAVAQIHNNIHYAVGLHPYSVNDFSAEPEQLAEALHIWFKSCATNAAKMPVALGECGLDGSIDTPLSRQQALLAVQLRFAAERQLPVILHGYKAHNELLQMLNACPLPAGGVLHGFSGSVEQALQFWQRGIYLGIGGTITYARAVKTRAAVAQLPAEAIVLETDAPDMPLHGYQGQPNSPLQLVKVARVLADLRGEDAVVVARQTTENAMRLLRLAEVVNRVNGGDDNV